METIKPGERVIYDVMSLDGIHVGVTWHGIIQPRKIGNAAPRAYSLDGFQVALMETGVYDPPHGRLHYKPIGWDDAAMEPDGAAAATKELLAGDQPIWRQKFPDTGGNVGEGDFQNIYRGKNLMFIVGTRSGSHQGAGADDQVPVGEAYLDAPLSAYMICNPDNAGANEVVVHCTAR